MSVVNHYGDVIKHYADQKPNVARGMVDVGLSLEHYRSAKHADKRIPASYRYLNTMALGMVQKGMREPEMTCWNNLFAPVELMESFDINCLSMEALSSFYSGFTIEDRLIDESDAIGIAKTLCTYHRNFIGANSLGLLRKPTACVTTSSICDGNTNTFRFVCSERRIPFFLVDVPHQLCDESIAYVEQQLKELVVFLEDNYHLKYDERELARILARENESHRLYEKYLSLIGTRKLASTLTLQMFILFASHLSIGSEESLKFYQMLVDDVTAAPPFDGKKILWVHVLPFFEESLKQVFNLSDDNQIQCVEMNSDGNGYLNPQHPLHSLASKLVSNVYNRGYEAKAQLCSELAKKCNCDGVIHFAHWGCKQTSGGVNILKKRLQEDGIPLLLLDGDAVDRRNDGAGQIRTRVEAFMEMLSGEKK
jgi:benzoyl-CoA reductase/2-hydroxyglutaryl-CoA dehydratase subunit BcrC/BadD/HgdB